MNLKLGIQHCVLKLYKIYINDDHGSTMTYFMARSNLIAYAIEWGKTVTKSFNEKILYCLHCALDENKDKEIKIKKPYLTSLIIFNRQH